MCNNCIHKPVCGKFRATGGHVRECEHFKDKAKIVEMPCNVGDYVYYIKGGYYKEAKFCEVSRPCKIVEVSLKLQRASGNIMRGFITDNGTRYSFGGIGKTVFLTSEEAETALKKRVGAEDA